MTTAARPRRFEPSEPLLLAIETAGSGCSAAILRGSETLAAEDRPLRHGHAEVLLPMVDRVARAAGIEPGELASVAAAIGPGGFTGIRAGLAAAHGIALATAGRLVGVTSFAAVAAAARIRGSGRRSGQTATTDNAPRLLIALDSRRADFYIQLFADDHATPLAEPASIPPSGLQSYISALIGGSASLVIAGDMAESAADALGTERPVDLVPGSAPDALGVAAAALFGLRSGAAPGVTANGPVRPFYLRAPDVTPPPAKISAPVAGL
ncbi:MAG: tRNA (adenosine(37)-N6)-threonylcarbamoyltransferase complex dimerization subunit type 1 TsaB [Alphaproteobacteria bacterium]